MRMYDLILKKRGGGELSFDEIGYFIDGYCDGSVPDYQASALLMAIFFKGMTESETATLTECMANSGDTVDLSRFGELSCDKHSTGGVGDKTTLIVAPLVASLGGKVAKMSGRGLGHTGGTVDKLESIPGYKSTMPIEDFLRQVEKTGVAVIGQSGDLTPADKKLYALRDVTATVDIIPLIASSVMSKKLAAGAHSIVLDVTVGSGAFMKSLSDARRLAEQMVAIGKAHKRKVSALITDMDKPLGKAVGNTIELCEAVDVLKGNVKGELREVSVALASEMLSLCMGWTAEEAVRRCEQEIDNGKAFEKFCEWIHAQGGRLETLKMPKEVHTVVSRSSGLITAVNAQTVGQCAMLLGAGRAKKDDIIDPNAGIVFNKTVGYRVETGEPVARLYTSDYSKIPQVEMLLNSAISFGEKADKYRPTVFEKVR